MFPDADSSDSLTGSFEWVEVPSGGIEDVTDSYPRIFPRPSGRTGITPNSRATSSAVSIVKGRTYAFRAKGTDRAPYSLTGPWSEWCQFAADTTVPPAPTVTPGDIAGPGQSMSFTFTTDAADVTTFWYGFYDPPTSPVAATGSGTKSATVTLTVPHFGQNTLRVRGIDATGNRGNVGSVTFTAPRPAPPVARWGLEQYPGVDEAAALADQQPGLVGDTDLVATDVAWADDVRLIGGRTADFDGGMSQASTSEPIIDTTKSFAVNAWVKLGEVGDPLPNRDQIAVSQDGAWNSSFSLGFRAETSSWGMWMHAEDAAGSGEAISVKGDTPVMGKWTNLTGTYDANWKLLELHIDGERLGWKHGVEPEPWPDRQRVAIGRGLWQGNSTNFWSGQIADVQVFDRHIVLTDFRGKLASSPTSGGFNEPGILTPIQVGDWDFETAVSCYVANLRDTCEAPDTGTSWGRWLALTRGSAIGAGHSGSGSGLWLDDEYFGDTEWTEEYGRSAVKVGTTPPDDDGLEFTQWQEERVLLTDQSFTISAWVMLDELGRNQTAVAQQGGDTWSSGAIEYDSHSGRWRFAIHSEVSGTTYLDYVLSSLPAEAGVWTHLVGVYDAGSQEIVLYVNGVVQGYWADWQTPFIPNASSGPLLVGGTLWGGRLSDEWGGGIDSVAVFQGAMNDVMVSTLYDLQAAPG